MYVHMIPMTTATTAAAATAVATTAATPQQRVTMIADEVRAMISRGDVDASSAFGILKSAAAVGASWEMAESVLVELAKGADGIAGTADDLIPSSTVQLIKVMLRHGVVRDIAAWASELLSPATTGTSPWYSRLLTRLKTIVTKKTA
jgi:hypothetical protein